LNSAASALKEPVTESGSSISRSTLLIALTALPREASGARSKEIVAAGNCSSWAIDKGAVVRRTLAMVASGTCGPPLMAVVTVGVDDAPSAVASAVLVEPAT
jgi:hypothetical protein